MVAMRKPTFTPEQYLQIERTAAFRSEYLDGEMIAMAGSTKAHYRIARCIARYLEDRLENLPFEVFMTDMRTRTVSRRHYTYPDVVVTAADTPTEDSHGDTLIDPIAVFEVLSPSTEKYDREEKFQLYSQVPSFREYVLVSQDRVHVEQYVRLDSGGWTKTDLTDLGAVLRLDSVPAEIPLAEIYRNSNFAPPSGP